MQSTEVQEIRTGDERGDTAPSSTLPGGRLPPELSNERNRPHVQIGRQIDPRWHSGYETVLTRSSAALRGRWVWIGAFLLVVLLNGSSFPATKAGLAHVPPLLFAGVRYTLAAALLLGYARLRMPYWRPHTRGDLDATLWGGVFIVGGIGLLFVGQQYTTSGVAAVLTCSTPIVTVVLSRLLLPAERLAPLGVVGILLGFLGVSVVVGPGSTAGSGDGALGPLAILLATVSFSLGTVLVRRSSPAMPAVPLAGWTMLVGAGLQFGFSLALGESMSGFDAAPAFLLMLGYLVVLPGAVGFVVYLRLVDRLGPQRTSLGSYLTPVVAMLGGAVFLGEGIPLTALVGFTIIAAGFGVLTISGLGVGRTRREPVQYDAA